MNLVLLGPPGAGKGTQAVFMTGQWGIPKISSGDILRSVAQRGGEFGRRVADLIDHGQMVPDELIEEIIWRRLDEPDARTGFVLDGFPRTVAQAEALEHYLKEHGRVLTAVINLEVDEDELVRRLSGRRVCPQCQQIYHIPSRPPREPNRCDIDGSQLEQRADDHPQAIRQRLNLYHQRTEPVLDYYRKTSLLHLIQGDQPVARVTVEIEQAVARGAVTAPIADPTNCALHLAPYHEPGAVPIRRTG